MMNAYLSVFIDFVVLLFLGATIFYVLRLSKVLGEFKKQRNQLDSVITNMISSIDQAERTVHSLKQTGAKEVADLEKLVNESKSLSDELKIINEASESMAKRLENLAETNRKIVQPSRNPDPPQARPSRAKAEHRQYREEKISSPVRDDVEVQPSSIQRKSDYMSTLRNVVDEEKQRRQDDGFAEENIPSFMIKDREFLESDDNDDETDILQSQAEKELFAALRQSGKNKGTGR